MFPNLSGGEGPGVSGLNPPEPGNLSKVKGSRVPPGWAAARLRLQCAFALHQDRPGDACGHLEEGRRLRTSWDRVGGGRQEAQDALARPLAATGTVAGRGKAAAGMQMSPNVPKYPGLSCLSFPPGGSVGGNARMSKGLRFWLRCSGPE